MLMRSSDDHFDGSRGSDNASNSTLPPSGLAIVTSTPRSISS
jgi:hypothetical protein